MLSKKKAPNVEKIDIENNIDLSQVESLIRLSNELKYKSNKKSDYEDEIDNISQLKKRGWLFYSVINIPVILGLIFSMAFTNEIKKIHEEHGYYKNMNTVPVDVLYKRGFENFKTITEDEKTEEIYSKELGYYIYNKSVLSKDDSKYELNDYEIAYVVSDNRLVQKTVLGVTLLILILMLIGVYLYVFTIVDMIKKYKYGKNWESELKEKKEKVKVLDIELNNMKDDYQNIWKFMFDGSQDISVNQIYKKAFQTENRGRNTIVNMLIDGQVDKNLTLEKNWQKNVTYDLNLSHVEMDVDISSMINFLKNSGDK